MKGDLKNIETIKKQKESWRETGLSFTLIKKI